MFFFINNSLTHDMFSTVYLVSVSEPDLSYKLLYLYIASTICMCCVMNYDVLFNIVFLFLQFVQFM